MTRKELLESVRKVINRQQLGGCLSGEDDAFFRELMPRHPYPEDFAVGIRFFFIAKNWVGHRALYARLSDDRVIDVGYRSFGQTKTESWCRHVHAAMRAAVCKQNVEVRKPGYELHHVTRFKDLAAAFFGAHRWVEGARGVSFDEFGVEVTHFDLGGCRLLNADLLRQWQDFHQRHAVIQVMTKEEHLNEHARPCA